MTTSRQTKILTKVLTQTSDRDAAADCTGVYFAGCYGAEYRAERYSDEQLIHRILNDISQVRR